MLKAKPYSIDCIIIKPRLAGQDEEGGEIEYWIDVAKGKDANYL